MLIELNTDTLLQNNLSANQFVIAILISSQNYKTISELYKFNSLEFKSDLVTLAKNGFITIGSEDLEKLKIEPKFAQLIANGDFFDEFVNLYPVKTFRKDGTTDYLRTDLTRMRKAYNKITKGKKDIHDNIIKCLLYELNKKEKEGSMSYMKRLSKWISSEEWKLYESIVDDECLVDTKEERFYGTEVI